MRVALLGGSGFVGQELTRQLLTQGHTPLILTRSPEKTAPTLPMGAEATGYDTDIAESMAKALRGADALVNLAGESIGEGLWSEEKKRRIRASRIETTNRLVQALSDIPATERPSVLVQGSAIGYYGAGGEGPAAAIITEENPPGTSFLAQVCVDWEAASAPVEPLGLRRCLARTGVVLDAGGGVLKKFLTPFKYFLGGPLGSGRQWLSWIHRADEAGAILHLLETETASGPYNLTAPNPATMEAFCRKLGKALDRPSWLPVPGFAITALLGEMGKELVLSSQRIAPKRLLESGYVFRHPELGPALEAALT